MKNVDIIMISILFCWFYLFFVLLDINEWWCFILFDNLNCVKMWFFVWNWYYVYNFCFGINGLIKYIYFVIYGEIYWFFLCNIGIIFLKKGVNFNYYINLLKVRFKVYKMCILKEIFVRFLILMVWYYM